MSTETKALVAERLAVIEARLARLTDRLDAVEAARPLTVAVAA
jgi:hypothetical protein